MGSAGNGRVGKQPAKSGDKRSKAGMRLSPQEEELRRLRAQWHLERARDAERRRNGLDAAPVRAEKPSSPSALGSGSAPGFGKSSGKGRKKKARAASYKEFPGSRPVPVADRGVDPLNGLPKIASAYMRLTPEEAQRERQKRLAGGNKAEERRLAKLARKIQAARKTGADR